MQQITYLENQQIRIMQVHSLLLLKGKFAELQKHKHCNVGLIYMRDTKDALRVLKSSFSDCQKCLHVQDQKGHLF